MGEQNHLFMCYLLNNTACNVYFQGSGLWMCCCCWGGGRWWARFVTVVCVTETVVELCPTCVLTASLGPLPTSGLQPDSLVSQPVSTLPVGVPACLNLTRWCPSLSQSDSLVSQPVSTLPVGVPACLSLIC